MPTRGPKVTTRLNSRKGPAGSIPHATLKAPCSLDAVGKAEYERLIGVLTSNGMLERIDLACVANAARVKSLLDRAFKAVEDNMDSKKVNLVTMLTSQHRGLMRELSLTAQPSKSVFRATPATSTEATDKWASKLKVG